MAEFMGKQGRWVTYLGRHIFIEDGKDQDAVIEEQLKRAGGYEYAQFKKEKAEKAQKSGVEKNKKDLADNFDKISVGKTASIPVRVGGMLNEDTKMQDLPLMVDGHKIIPLKSDYTPFDENSKDWSDYRASMFAVKIGDEVKTFGSGVGSEKNDYRSLYHIADAYKHAVEEIKKSSGKKEEDLVDKQEKEIAKRAEQTKALNDEKKSTDAATSYEARKKQMVDNYRKEFKQALAKNNGKMPRRINVDMNNTVQKDAVFSAIDAEYKLSQEEEKIWDMVRFSGGSNPKMYLPGKVVSTLGLSNAGVSGLRKWLAVWGLKNL